MDHAALQTFVNQRWDQAIVPALTDYIRIPNKSLAFDPDWQAHGLIDQVVERFHQWALGHPLGGMTIEVIRLKGRTPLLLIEMPGQGDDCVLLYGHLDKQPEMTGWSEGLGPWEPVIRGDRLYGRGAADDGYAMFACLSAIGALQSQGVPHARCVMLIEACEESGSFDLPHISITSGMRIGTAEPGDRAGLRMRQLRPAMVHDLAARPGGRHAAGRRADRRRAFRRRQWNCAVELPDRADAFKPYRG